jgi:hypothetical protein
MKSSTDIIETWSARPYSWSQHSSFLWDKEQWFRGYVLNERSESTPAMEFGKKVGDSLGTPSSMIPQFPTLPYKEFEVRADFDGTELVGFFDFYDDDIPMIQENKTSTNKEKWTQESVDSHGQLDMYALLLMLPHKAGMNGNLAPHRSISPKDVRIKLYYIPVVEDGFFQYRVEGTWQEFETKRTLKDVLRFGAEIKRVRKEMKNYAWERLENLGIQ